MYRLRACKVYKILSSYYSIATQITVTYFKSLSYRSLWKMYVETSVKKIPVLALRLFSLMLVRVTAVCVFFFFFKLAGGKNLALDSSNAPFVEDGLFPFF